MKKSPVIKILFAVLIVSLGLFYSCGIDTYQPAITLNPPHIDGIQISNSQILITFSAFNTETYFEGFKIYMDLQPTYLLDDGYLAQTYMVPNSSHDPSKPTIGSVPTMSAWTTFTYFVSTFSNNLALQSGITYYFTVRSYSAQYNIVSKPSNITNIVFP